MPTPPPWTVAALLAASTWSAAQAQSTTIRPAQPPPPPVAAVPAPPVTRDTGVFLGQVVDSTTGRAVGRAIVRLTGGGAAQTRIADDRGRFYFTGVAAGDWSIAASKTGYFDGAYGKRRESGAGIPLTLLPGQFGPDVRIELFRAASINGVVLDDAGEPVTGVRVRAWRREFAEGREQLLAASDVLSDDEGTYRLFGLRPGDYLVSVPGVQVTLPVEVVERDVAGAALTAEVTALLAIGGGTRPDDRALQPDGRYVLMTGRTATPPSSERGVTFAYPTHFFPGGTSAALAAPVTVGAGEHRFGLTLALQWMPTRRVSGIVIDRAGPVANQLVRLIVDGVDDQGLGSETAATITAADGTFTLLNVPRGDYVAQVRMLPAVATNAATGIAPGNREGGLASPPSRAWANLDVTVFDQDIENLVLLASPAATVFGRIAIDGWANRPPIGQVVRGDISLLPASRTLGAAVAAWPDTAGLFSLSDVVPGGYFVRVGALAPGWSVRSIVGNGRDLIDHALDVRTTANVTITLTDRGSVIWGTVRDARGLVVPGATVLVLAPSSSADRGLNPNRVRELRAATSGVYTTSGLPAGDYYVVAIDDALADGWQDPRRADALRAQATRVTLREGDRRTQDLRLALKR